MAKYFKHFGKHDYWQEYYDEYLQHLFNLIGTMTILSGSRPLTS